MEGIWNDQNRYHQDNPNEVTIYPEERNYKNLFLFMEDLEKAEQHELICHRYWDEESEVRRC